MVTSSKSKSKSYQLTPILLLLTLFSLCAPLFLVVCFICVLCVFARMNERREGKSELAGVEYFFLFSFKNGPRIHCVKWLRRVYATNQLFSKLSLQSNVIDIMYPVRFPAFACNISIAVIFQSNKQNRYLYNVYRIYIICTEMLCDYGILKLFSCIVVSIR